MNHVLNHAADLAPTSSLVKLWIIFVVVIVIEP